MNETTALKPRLKEYLAVKGIYPKSHNGAMRIHCPNPGHTDKDPTATYYDDYNNNHNIYCAVCGATWDIFEVAGLLNNLHSFPEQIEEVKKSLGIQINKPAWMKKYKALPYEEAKKKFTSKRLMEICEFVGEKISKKNGDDPVKTGEAARLAAWGNKITGAWPYRNQDGDLELLDARFEGTGRKVVISFYWTGKNVACSKPPVLLYNRDKLHQNPTTPRLIHEGAKCAKIAEENLPGFIHTTWNGGGQKARYVDFTLLGTKAPIYIYPDDDQKRGRDGELLPPEKQPGIKAAFIIAHRIITQIGNRFEIKIVQPYTKAREIKPDGADIVEALQVATPEELEKYILSSPGIEVPGKKSPPEPTTPDNPPADISILGKQPFKILGMAETGYAYYLDFSERICKIKPESLSKGFLKRLAPLEYWRGMHSAKMSGEDWDEATSAVIENTMKKDFDTDDILGRGAWKNPDGSFCFWDGVKMTGKGDPEKIYERKKPKPLGINGPPATVELRREIISVMKKMNFETKVDCIYFIAWCLLAPFSGVLQYRPPVLITGPPGVGKSTLFEKIARPLTKSLELTAKESSPAGCRQKNANNSEGIIIEEADTIDAESERNRKGFLSLMRVSFCEDAPDGYKGTPGHIPISFKMKNMFMFISVSPIVGDAADSDRLFFVNLKDQGNDWEALENEIDRLVVKKNCEMIRATTWGALKDIIAMTKKARKIIQKKTNLSSRRAHAEGLLISAYYLIWMGKEKDNLQDLEKLIHKIYTIKPAVDKRDQAEEMVTRVLDESVPVDGYRERMTLREIVQAISSGKMKTGNETDINGESILSAEKIQAFRNIAGRHGLAVISGSFLAIANNHHEIMKIIEMGQGYHRYFWRHPGIADKGKSVFMAGCTRRCTVIAGVIEDMAF